MMRISRPAWAFALVTLVVGSGPWQAQAAPAAGDRPAITKQAWTIEEARGELALNPHDPYLEYVVLQLARREGGQTAVDRELQAMTNAAAWQAQVAARHDQTNLFNTFTGALAVQESLQLDTMRGEQPRRPAQKFVKPADLKGPTIKSHPWEQMLAGRDPKVSALSLMVPADQYFIQCGSLTKLLDLTEVSDIWATHLFNQANQDATSSRVGERLREQLAVRSDPATRPFYDLVVQDVAVTGSDLFLREGSDLTLIFRLKQPAVFKPRMDGFLKEAAQQHPDAVRSTGKYLGVEYVSLATPDRRVHVFSAYPEANLHVRSNSQAGLERVLAAIKGKSADGKPVTRLGDTAEFKYIRTLMLDGAAEEDTFIYLSDPFIRYMVGPELKLKERRRMVAYNHLRMINNAAMLFRTEFGRNPKSLQELADTQCAPGLFGDGPLTNPNGGEYSLSPDGGMGLCSISGSSRELIPNGEIPLDDITQEEADQYQAFTEQYNQYWRTYFDPIAVRIQIGPQRYRVETIVLPLIDNSIYTGLKTALGGSPEPLDALPVPKGNIFSVGLKFDKSQLLGMVNNQVGWGQLPPIEDFHKFVNDGLGNQIGLHVYDSQQMFDFNLPSFLGELYGTFNGFSRMNGEMIWIAPLIASLNSPVYVSVPVQNPKIVDDFLDQLDAQLAVLARQPQRGFFLEIANDFYQLDADKSGPKVRGYALQLGPIKWRFFWARIGDGLYVASKKFILDDLVMAEAEQSNARAVAGDAAQLSSGHKAPATMAHAMVKIRPEHWKQVLPEYQLGWAENNRRACLNNLGPLSHVARAYAAAHPEASKDDPARTGDAIVHEAGQLYGVHFLSPDGGYYLLNPDGKTMGHSLYGSQLSPKQSTAPREQGSMAQLMGSFAGATAELTFLEDGLHAVLTLDKKSP